MASGTIEYQRLSRPHFGLNGTASLWLGPDHLLQVSNALGWERYRRWFFSDVQAFIIRRNATRLVWNIVVGLGGVFVGFGALAVLAAPSSSPGEQMGLNILAGVLGIIALGFLAIALVNTLLGPTCTFYLQTPHGMEKLAAPGRISVVERLIERVRPLAEAAQSSPGAGAHREVGEAFDQVGAP
jgi:hypothetical protein